MYELLVLPPLITASRCPFVLEGAVCSVGAVLAYRRALAQLITPLRFPFSPTERCLCPASLNGAFLPFVDSCSCSSQLYAMFFLEGIYCPLTALVAYYRVLFQYTPCWVISCAWRSESKHPGVHYSSFSKKATDILSKPVIQHRGDTPDRNIE